ncbi:CopD family protein [Streptomyces sp. NPDC051907]|uniref:CopD family protein n=1 Tax=Streptomyces sp. NPDC051907 TaxID=3155284 RepID=UPI003429CE70
MRRRSGAVPWLLVGGALAALALALLGVDVAGRGTGELRIPAAGTVTVLRAAVCAALAVHLGELAGARLVGAGPLPRSWALSAALAGALASGGQILRLAQVSGLDLASAYGTREGQLLLLMANGFLAAAGCVFLKREGWAAGPLAVVVGAEALRAHPEPYSPEIGAALTALHLTAASLWAGGLLYVLRTAWLRRGGREAFVRYARLAAWLFVVLAATGTASTLRRLPADVVFTTAYGRVLIAKLVLVALACALALVARRRLTRGKDARPPARLELGVLAGVVLLSAILTAVPDPHWLSIR